MHGYVMVDLRGYVLAAEVGSATFVACPAVTVALSRTSDKS
jgi:hypothetical protein